MHKVIKTNIYNIKLFKNAYLDSTSNLSIFLYGIKKWFAIELNIAEKVNIKKTEKTLSRGKFKNFRLNKIIKTNIVKKIFTLKLFQVSKEILFIFFEISVESLRL